MFDLLLGPSGDFSEAQLRRAWGIYRRELIDQLIDHPRPGLRPWGFWKFDFGRPELDQHENWSEGVKVLAERGDLTEGERGKLTLLGEDGS